MSFEIVCPLPSVLTEIPATDCPALNKIGQIQRFFPQIKQPSGSPPFPDLTSIQTEANWTAFRAATDATKIIKSPLTSSMVLPQSESITAGGNDNTTVDGIQEYFGEGFVSIEGQLKNISEEAFEALNKLTAYSLAEPDGTKLEMFFTNEFGNILAEEVGAAYKGFEVFNFRVSSRGTEGKNTNTMVAVRFDLKPCWDANLRIVKPDFDIKNLA